MANAIELHGVSKRYVLGEHHGGDTTLRDALTGRFGRLVGRRPAPPRELWSLRDVELEVPEGETLGVIGRNGAGKSTLLKVVTRITEPTTGVSRTRGRVGALLEVGTGFHPELTGRENVFLNGAILGMTEADVRRHFDAIVDFSGMEKFLDTEVKHYSSGMFLRLAFAVAVHTEPDVFLVDEILAVGDPPFRRKCVERVQQLSTEGRTLLVVSHDLPTVREVCSRGVVLDAGQKVEDGSLQGAIDALATRR